MHRQKMKRTKRNTYLWQLLATLLLLVTPGMFSACSSDDTNTTSPATNDSEIRFDVGVWNMMEGTRATFYETGVQNSGSFTCAAFSANSTTSYLGYTTVNWVADAWVFSDGKHYWPATGSLDFFAYMPAEIPSYITDINGTASSVTYAERNPQFKCKNLPMTYKSSYTDDQSAFHPAEGQTGDLKEFVYALAMDQDKAGTNTTAQPTAGKVALSFKHPFARINLQLAANHPDIIINTITFKSLKNNGTCSFDGTTSTWTPSGESTNFVVTLNEAITNSDAVHVLGVPFIMIPQDWNGEIEVNASWNDWGDTPVPHTVTTTIPAITWLPGYSYTYTFTISPDDLTVNTTNFTEQW